MEGFQLHGGLVNPRAALHHADGVVELGVKREEVQLYILAIDVLTGVEHVLNKLAVGRSCRMHADDALRLFPTLLIGSFFIDVHLIAVQCLFASLVRRDHRRCQYLVEVVCHRFARGRMSDDEQRAVQPSQLLRTVVEAVPAPRHQCHQQPTCHKERSRKLSPLQTFAHILQHREVVEQCFNLSTPSVHLLQHHVAGIAAFGDHVADYILIGFPSHLCDGLLHGLTGIRSWRFLLLLHHTICG